MTTEALQELRVSNDARNDAGELRHRVEEDGYLFFRKLLNPDRLMDLRRQIMAVLNGGGWLRSGSDPAQGIADVSRRCTEGDRPYFEVYGKVQRLELFHRIPHEPDLVELVERIIGAPDVLARGGRVVSIPFEHQRSTSRLISRIRGARS